MRILIATGLYPPENGGPATYTKLLEERLPALGFKVSVLPFREVRHLPPVVRHLAYFWKCLLRSRAVDMVYAQDTVSVGLPAALATKLSGKKFSVRVPGDYAWEQGRQRFGVTESLDEFQHARYGWRVELLRALQRFVIRSANLVIAPSEYLAGIVRQWGVGPVVVYNGINTSIETEVPKERPEGFLIVSIGRRVPWKGFEALERVVAKEKDWHLRIIENLPRAEALGWVKAADVLVLNSTYEGLSHVLLETMALGTPIIATNVGGNPELIENGKNGLLIPPEDEEALHAALTEVQQNPTGAQERSFVAQQRVQDFSVDKTLAKLNGVLKNLYQ